jgi:hypothetical protein
MTTPITAVHTREFDSVFVKATNVATTATDRVAGVKEFSVESSRAMTELVYLGEDISSHKASNKTMKFSMSGHVMRGDAVQTALRTAHDTGTPVYLTVIDDPDGTVGATGRRFCVLVESYTEKRPQGDVIGFDCAFVLGDTAITAV